MKNRCLATSQLTDLALVGGHIQCHHHSGPLATKPAIGKLNRFFGLAKTLRLTPLRNDTKWNGKIKGTRSCVGIFDAGHKDIQCFSTPSRRQASCHASKGRKRPGRYYEKICFAFKHVFWFPSIPTVGCFGAYLMAPSNSVCVFHTKVFACVVRVKPT